MNRLTQYLAAAIVFISLSSMDISSPESTSAIYSFTRDGSSSPLIQLTLNKDNTFEYVDKSNKKNIVDTKGKYILKGSTVKLYDYQSEVSMASKWHIDEKNNCIRSKKGLKFTRICNCH